jgi:hypothetical protein
MAAELALLAAQRLNKEQDPNDFDHPDNVRKRAEAESVAALHNQQYASNPGISTVQPAFIISTASRR